MQYEVEQKFLCDDHSAVACTIGELGASLERPIFQSDIYLTHPARDFGRTDEGLRVRTDGRTTYVTYKGPRVDPLTMTRAELELRILGGEESRSQFMELLDLLGFGILAVVRKNRRSATVVWDHAAINVVLDDVEYLGKFVELEISVPEAELGMARQRIASLAGRLGLTKNERRSYCELVLAARRGNPP